MKIAAILPGAKLLAIALAATLPLAACQQAAKDGAAADPDAKPGLSISDAKLVLPVVKGNPGAAYFTLKNAGAGATSLAAVHIDGVGKTEMHETKGGTMSQINWVEIKPGESVQFARGGKHVMAFNIADSLVAGGTAEMTLTFSGGDKLSTPIKVEAMTGAGNAMAGMDHGSMR